jgi:hypothetical protein
MKLRWTWSRNPLRTMLMANKYRVSPMPSRRWHALYRNLSCTVGLFKKLIHRLLEEVQTENGESEKMFEWVLDKILCERYRSLLLPLQSVGMAWKMVCINSDGDKSFVAVSGRGPTQTRPLVASPSTSSLLLSRNTTVGVEAHVATVARASSTQTQNPPWAASPSTSSLLLSRNTTVGVVETVATAVTVSSAPT